MFTKIKYKLLLCFIILGIVPLGIIMLMEYYNYVEGLKNRSFTQLKTVREIKKREIENYFSNTNKEISLFAQSQVVIEAMKGFKKSFHSITKKNLPNGYPDKLKQYYLNEFRKKVNTPDTNAIDFSSLVPTNPASVLLQVEYLGGNKSLLKPLPFDKVHEQYHNFFSDFIKTTGYYDLLLVDDETGYIVYSVEKEVDFGTNLLDGPYANTNMGHLFRKLRDSDSGKQTNLCDFERYLPSYLAPASFIATPVFDGDKKIGTLIFQIPIEKLDAITINKKTWRAEGLGETGECYVVGKDCRLRTNSRFIIEEPQQFFTIMEKNSYDKAQIDLMKYYKTTILFQAKCNNAISKSGNDQTGLTITKDYRGVEVMSAYTALNIPDVNWVIMAEMDVSEVFASVYLYRLNSLIIVGVVFIILIVVAFSIARSIYKPINILVEGAKELGKGNLNVQLNIKNKDEFGLLANAFNIGVSALKNNRNEILENALDNERKLNEELTQREEELTANEEELRQSIESQSVLLDEIQLKKVSLSALINNTNDFIYSLDKNFRLDEFNNSVRDFYLKREVELFKGMHVRDFITKKNIEEALKVFDKVLQGHGEIAVIEVPDNNGKMLFFESSHNPIRNENKEVIGISIMIREVTERIKVLQALKASEEKFSKAFKSSPDSVLITAVKDSRLVEFNEGFLTWSGYTREEVVGKTTIELDFWDLEERANLKKNLLEHGKIVEMEVHLKIKSGEVRDCLISAETMEFEGELCLISITRDITVRKKNQELLVELLEKEKQLNYELSQREEELSSSEEELRQSFESQSNLLEEIQLKEANVSALMNNTTDLIYSTDREFRLVEFNTSIYLFFKDRGVQLYKGMRIRDFVHVKNIDGAMTALHKAMQGEPNIYLFDIPQNNDIIHFEGYYNPIVNESKEILGVSVVIRNITERKKAEDAVKASEEKYSSWFRSSPDSIIISTLNDGKIIEVNDSFEILSGYKREDVIGKTTIELNFFESPVIREQLGKLLIQNRRISNYEIIGRKKSMEEMVLLVSAEILEIEGQQCLISVSRDVTKLKKAEEEIKFTNERLKLVIDNIPVAIWTLDKNGIITFSEGKALENMGLKPGENVGESIYDIDKYKPEYIGYIKLVLEQGITQRINYGVEDYYYEDILSPILDNRNEIVGLIGVSYDVTELKKNEIKLIENESLLNNIIDHLPVGLQIFDSQGYSLKMNEAQSRLLGLKNKKEESGKFNALTDSLNTFMGMDKLFTKAFNGEVIENVELRIDFKALQDVRYGRNDLVWYNLWLFPLFNKEGKVQAIINLLSDITERKLSEEKIEQKNEELIKVNKMMADYKLMALRSAMNPHFIFNTLNSIQYFILKNDRVNAVNYISTFAKLIRNILNNSLGNKIKLADEIDQIRNYVDLERMRFELKFDFILTVDEELDIDNTEISPMLIQPYIENAILHGLYNKTEKGILKVTIKEDGYFILIEIEDDGVGRELAAKFKSQTSLDYKSMGTSITEERLKLINDQFDSKPEIQDLYKDGLPAGTRIKLWIN